MNDKTFLSQVKGFTPVIDVLAEELGMVTALIYGIAWRYCQMEDRVCHASKETIAAHANISTKTVQRHLHKLVEAGYLEDTTPDWKHKPHIYKDAGKVQINGLVEAKLVGRPESPTSKQGGSESPTRGDRESQQGRTESPVKKDSYETLKERKERGAAEKTPPTPTLREQAEKGEMTTETELALLCGFGRQGKAGIADPSQDIEQYMRYTNDFLEMYRKRTGLHADSHVQKPCIQEIAIQPDADLDLWDKVITAWVKHGWNKRNVAGMIECYERREIPSTGKNGAKNAQPAHPQQLTEHQERIAAAFESNPRDSGG